MLRKTRLTLAVLLFLAVTTLFLDFTGTIHAWLGWTAKIQFLPTLLALNAGVVIGLVLLTLLLGRVYCSVICPLGVMQDIGAGKESRWRTGRHCRQENARPDYPDCSSRSTEPAQHSHALHCLPALCVGLSQRRAASLD